MTLVPLRIPLYLRISTLPPAAVINSVVADNCSALTFSSALPFNFLAWIVTLCDVDGTKPEGRTKV